MKKEKSVAPLNPLKSINIEDLIPGIHYFVVVEEDERYGRGAVEVFKGTGESVIEFLKKMYNYGEWEADYIEDNETLPASAEFLSWVSEVNGDGYNYTQIFEM